MSSLVVEGLTKALGGKTVVDRVSLEVSSGELLCLLGPSGCGKTTTLRMVAGFVVPDAGRVFIGGRDVTGTRPERRPTAMVFQNYALWPHMSVEANVSFGLRASGLSRREARTRATEALATVGIDWAAQRRPASLSGGEQQRVALARALVQKPEVMLLDEPLSNLDAQLRLQVREELAELHLQTGITMVFVTHDQDEALSIADRVAIMRSGTLEQLADPKTIYRLPASEFVASFVGRMSWLDAKLEGGTLYVGGRAWPGRPSWMGVSARDSGPLRLAVRPEDLTCHHLGVPGRVRRRVSRGHFDELLVDLPGANGCRSYLRPGEPVDPCERWWPIRALAYRDGQLLSEWVLDPGAAAAGRGLVRRAGVDSA